MTLHETYCSVNFLEELYSHLRRYEEDSDEDFHEPEHLQSLKKLIHRYSDLILDIPKQEIFERSLNRNHPHFNPGLKKLWKEGRQNFVSIPETFVQLKTDEDYFIGKTTELYFIDEIEKFCTDIRNNNGIQCLNFSQFPDLEEEIFDISTLIIRKDKLSEIWGMFRNICPPTNSLIIIDQYLIKEAASKTENLYPLLESLMPASLSFKYDLAIFISEESNQPLDILYNEIETFLVTKFDYEVNLTLLQTKKSNIHDRYILSNRYWIESGHGFDLVRLEDGKSKGCKNTKIIIFPITLLTRAPKNWNQNIPESNALNDWRALIETYKGILKNTQRKTGRVINIIGSGSHRLLK